MIIFAKDIKVGNQFKSGKSIQEVISIECFTDKTVTFWTKRISPNPHDGPFFQRKSLLTKITVL